MNNGLDEELLPMRSEIIVNKQVESQNISLERQQKFFEKMFEQQAERMNRFERMFELMMNNMQPAHVFQQQAHVQQQQAPALQQPAPVLQQQQPAHVLQQQQAPALQQPNILLINSKQNIRIEDFTGNSDIFDFLKDIEYYAETDKLSSAEKVKLVFSSVSRQIRLWLSSLPEDERSNYVSLKHKLISQYCLKK